MKILTFFVSIPFFVGLTACSSVPKAGTTEYAQWEKEQKQEIRLEDSEAGIDLTPSWFLRGECPSSVVCATATAASEDLQIAIDKALLDAKFIVADKLSGVLSANMKRYVEEIGGVDDPSVHQETNKVVQTVVTEANLGGYRIAKQQIVPTKEGYRAFIQVEYPIGNANRVLVAETQKNNLLDSRFRASKAFADLEAEINAAKNK